MRMRVGGKHIWERAGGNRAVPSNPTVIQIRRLRRYGRSRAAIWSQGCHLPSSYEMQLELTVEDFVSIAVVATRSVSILSVLSIQWLAVTC